MQTIRTVLHGGLGNQLFQFFVAHLELRHADSAQLVLYDDKLAQYSSARNLELEPLLTLLPAVQIAKSDLVARFRLPKLGWKLLKQDRVWRIPGYGVLVDGYFQNPKLLADSYTAADREAVIHAWRGALKPRHLAAQATCERVTHFRLGDFFSSQEAALAAAHERLDRLTGDTDLMTNQEDLVQLALEQRPRRSAVRIASTQGMSAWQVLHMFSMYRRVDTNGSSLALWAAILSGAEFTSSNPEHVAIWRLLDAV